jgi:hypothetical protein
VTDNLGPPGGRDDDARPKPGHAEPVATTPPNNRKPNPPRRHCGADALAGLRRRHAAARRLPPLGPCGCIRDPRDQHRCGGEISDHMVDAYKAAASHLLSLGLWPAPFLPELRELWRRGDDRRLVSEIAERWELAG